MGEFWVRGSVGEREWEGGRGGEVQGGRVESDERSECRVEERMGGE